MSDSASLRAVIMCARQDEMTSYTYDATGEAYREISQFLVTAEGHAFLGAGAGGCGLGVDCVFAGVVALPGDE